MSVVIHTAISKKIRSSEESVYIGQMTPSLVLKFYVMNFKEAIQKQVLEFR